MTTPSSKAAIRREVKSRNTRWAQLGAAWIAKHGISPNAVSLTGIVFALAGGVCLAFFPYGNFAEKMILITLAVVGIQGRLLCNLFDGMVAMEWGKKTKSGELFNDFPDRLSDTFLLVGAGLAIGTQWGVILGFGVAVAAMLTAYARVLAGAAGATQQFLGPMAKQHRMALLTMLLVLSAALIGRGDAVHWVMGIGLSVMLLGALVTIWRRLAGAYRELENKK